MPGGTILEVASHSGHGNGILFEGTEGNIHVNRERVRGNIYENERVQDNFTEDDYNALSHGKPLNWELDGSNRHKQNMIDCIRDGGLPVSEINANIQGVNMCHAVCITSRLGRELVWDAQTETFVNDDHANTFIAREQRKGFEIPRVG
jgi:hypothetical protein